MSSKPYNNNNNNETLPPSLSNLYFPPVLPFLNIKRKEEGNNCGSSYRREVEEKNENNNKSLIERFSGSELPWLKKMILLSYKKNEKDPIIPIPIQKRKRRKNICKFCCKYEEEKRRKRRKKKRRRKIKSV